MDTKNVNKPFYKKAWFWIVIVAMFAFGATNSEPVAANEGPNMNINQPVVYQEISVDDLVDILNDNPMKAEQYEGQYVAVTGRLNNIDSDGEYLSIYPMHDDWSLDGVQCFMRNDDQRSDAMNLSLGDIITIRGRISNVGEVMGYTMDITERLS